MLARYARRGVDEGEAERAGLVGGIRAVQVPRPFATIARRAAACLLVLLALALALGARTALAEGGIQDVASIFSPAGAQVALAHIRKIGADTGVDVHVVAVNHLSGGRDVGTEAQQVFDAQRMRGVLLYVSKDDQQLAVHVGADARSAITLQEQMAIRDSVIAGFRQGDYDGGLLAGIDRIGRDVQDLRLGRVAPSNPSAVTPAAARRGAGLTWASVPLAVTVGVLAAFLWLRRKSRPPHAPPELVAAAMEADRPGAAAGRPASEVTAAGASPERSAPDETVKESWAPRDGPFQGAELEHGQDEKAAEARRRA